MLKVLLLIECDCCNSVSATAADASRVDGESWAIQAENFECSLFDLGWQSYVKKYSYLRKHTCSECILAEDFKRDFGKK
jgi:hypothetical protein